MRRLSDQEITEHLQDLDGWTVKDGKLHRDLEFADFNAAFGFMTRAAMEIEKMNHHPEWSNVYNRITVDLVTHDAQGITEYDIKLAKILDSLR